MILVVVLTKGKKKVQKQIMQTFEPLYEDLDSNRTSSMINTFFFVLRRLLLILTAVLLKNHPSLQIMIFSLLSELSLAYLVYFKPYTSANNNEIFNELCILVGGLQLFVFTNFVSDVRVKDAVGYLLIGTIMLNFITNILIQVVVSAKLGFKLI